MFLRKKKDVSSDVIIRGSTGDHLLPAYGHVTSKKGNVGLRLYVKVNLNEKERSVS